MRRTDPPTARRPARFTVAFAVALVVTLLGAEVAVRLSADRLDEPLIYFSGPAQTAVHDMDVLQDAGIDSDLTFVGTSMVRRGIDANRFEGPLPDVEHAHNVALPGAQTPVVERWLLDEVIPRLHSKRVVWGLSSIDFNDGRPNKTIDQYLAARASEPGFTGDLDRLMLDLALSKHRDQLRDPAALVQAARGQGVKYTRQRPLDRRAVWDLQYPQLSDAKLAKMRANHRTTVRDKQLADFHVGARELDAFRATVRELQAQGIDVVIVLMPVPTTFLDLHPDGPDQFLEFAARIQAEGERLGVTVLDHHDVMDDDDFRDYEHLWVEAAHRYSDRLAADLAALGW